MTSLVLIGGGEHARVIVDAARSRPESWDVAGYVDRESMAAMEAHDVLWLGDDDTALTRVEATDHRYVIAIGGDIALRRELAERYSSAGAAWATIVHRDATVSPSAVLGSGVVVFAGAVINSQAVLEDHCIINTGAVIEHDVRLGPFVHIGPRAVLGGGADVGDGAHIGLGAAIRDHIRIGSSAVVGMGSAVTSSVADNAVVGGVPARPLETS